MSYVEIDVTQYGGLEPRTFTYQAADQVAVGQLVLVQFGRQQSLGVVRRVDVRPAQHLRNKLRPIKERIAVPPLPLATLELADWMKRYYVASSHQVWTTILPSGLQAKRRHKSKETIITPPHTPITLSDDQQRALTSIQASSQPVILQGVTGSGKTHIYEELVRQALKSGKSALLLVPEIFLTRQLHKRLEQQFPDEIIASHSELTAAARRNIWIDALTNTAPKLFVGPRSILFLPLKKLGLIIIDETHDTSYKQENAPRYIARDVAARLAQLTTTKLILASATPDITSLWLAEQDKLNLVSLKDRHGKQSLPSIRLIDTKQLHQPLAPESIAAIADRLKRGEQILILHNKRGSARRLSCEACGETVICPRCDSTLIFHADIGKLRCHTCDFQQFPPAQCPSCKEPQLHFHGFGTKQLEVELKERFPQARLARIDRDESQTSSLGDTLLASERGEVDILLGTQMIAKGLNIEGITLAIIIGADELVNGSDFASREHGLALIMQAAGRAGRADQPGEVLIQTRRPDDQLFDAIRNHDWTTVYKAELIRRKQFRYPPFCYLAKIHFIASSLNSAQKRAQAWLSETALPNNVEAIGPAIPNHYRTAGTRYHCQVILKAGRRSDLTELLQHVPPNTLIDIDPISLF